MQPVRPFWQNVWQLIKPYWTSEEKWRAYILLSSIIACTIIQVRIMVIFNHWRKQFYDALQAFDMHGLLYLLGQFSLILLSAVLIFSYGSYFIGLLSNHWRRWMTHRYVNQWLENHVAYAMQILHRQMDNPDQRISEDLNEFPQLTLNLFSGLLNSVLTLFSFSFILWQLSGSLGFIFYHHRFAIPGYMFFTTIIYAGIGTLIIGWLGKHLVRLNYQQEQFNANFRFGLIRVRESTEQIAFYRGENTEKAGLMVTFINVFDNFLRVIQLQKQLAFFTNGYNLLTQVVGILIALPRYIGERMAIGNLMQASGAFEQVVSALSFVVFSFTAIANWRAVIQRLTEFTQLMQSSNKQFSEKYIMVKKIDAALIEVKNLILMSPRETALFGPLNFTIHPGDHVFITGRYGSGKSTLLRALANIWPYGSGEIYLPKKENMMFLPQKPYFPLGTLKQALAYPSDAETISDEKINAVLTLCGLPQLKNHLNEVHYWSAEFSLGEQQIIAFARIFLNSPKWVFLDEATSALDETTEQHMYELLQTHFPTLTIISVGHRSTLKQFHSIEIKVMPCKTNNSVV